MLTLFAMPKAFHGHIGLIQRNAIQSWIALTPRPEVILLGDDEGTAEVAQEFGLRHIPAVERSNHGTPLVNSIFELAQQQGQGPLFVYINSDIVLMDDFIQAVQQIPFQRFMMTGQRWNLDLTEPLDFTQDWQSHLRDRVAASGWKEGPQAMDYFVFPRGVYTDIPPFAIGRLCWDNWLLYKAFSLNLPVIDATLGLVAVHQNHDYNHHPEGKQGVFLGEEAQRNRALMEHDGYRYFMLDLATYQLTATGLTRPGWTWERLDRHFSMMPLARPRLKPIYDFLLVLVRRRDQLPRLAAKVTEIPARIIRRLKRWVSPSLD
jgi:hypothetical protein